MRDVSDHISCLITIYRKSCRLWDNEEKCYTDGESTDTNVIRRTHFSCWIPKATNTHSEYIILIVFSRQQCLLERFSMLRYTYTACLVLLFSLFIFLTPHYHVITRESEVLYLIIMRYNSKHISKINGRRRPWDGINLEHSDSAWHLYTN
jgi:hypothetical protein